MDQGGLGISRPGEVKKDDDEFEIYRKRMMLAYRFRPNPLVCFNTMLFYFISFIYRITHEDRITRNCFHFCVIKKCKNSVLMGVAYSSG